MTEQEEFEEECNKLKKEIIEVVRRKNYTNRLSIVLVTLTFMAVRTAIGLYGNDRKKAKKMMIDIVDDVFKEDIDWKM